MKKRLDLLLVEKGLVPSRTKAQDLIRAGHVWVGDSAQLKPLTVVSALIDEESEIEIRRSELDRYVSRGGLKLEGALKKLNLSVKGLEVLDVGLSTGGFSDCLLQSGAQRVVGVDVGHSQLHPYLQTNSKLISLEGVNARELHSNSQVLAVKPEAGWDLVVVDVSFISLTLVLPAIVSVLKPQGLVLALVKPQFEVGPEGLGKGGVVKDISLYLQVETKIREKCLELNLKVRDYLESAIEGKDGNREFFVFAQKI